MAQDKLEITLEYCYLCGFGPRAAWIASEILQQFGEDISGFKLVPDIHGKFHIYFNGELVLQHSHNPHHWPEAAEVTEKVKEWKRTRVGARSR